MEGARSAGQGSARRSILETSSIASSVAAEDREDRLEQALVDGADGEAEGRRSDGR